MGSRLLTAHFRSWLCDSKRQRSVRRLNRHSCNAYGVHANIHDPRDVLTPFSQTLTPNTQTHAHTHTHTHTHAHIRTHAHVHTRALNYSHSRTRARHTLRAPVRQRQGDPEADETCDGIADEQLQTDLYWHKVTGRRMRTLLGLMTGTDSMVHMIMLGIVMEPLRLPHP